MIGVNVWWVHLAQWNIPSATVLTLGHKVVLNYYIVNEGCGGLLFKSRMRPVFWDSVVDSWSLTFSTSSGWTRSYKVVLNRSACKMQQKCCWTDVNIINRFYIALFLIKRNKEKDQKMRIRKSQGEKII